MTRRGWPRTGRGLADDCVVPAWPEFPAWQWVRAGDELWVNVPASGNWNWYNPDTAGSYCWEDLLHMDPPPSRVSPPAGVQWVCDECGHLFPGFPGSIAAGTYEYAYPASAPSCPGCGDEHCWPLPRTARTPPANPAAARDAAVRTMAAALEIPAEALGLAELGSGHGNWPLAGTVGVPATDQAVPPHPGDDQ